MSSSTTIDLPDSKATADMVEEAPEFSGNRLITINVGGQEFTTFISTLKSESKYFANLFSDKWNLSRMARLNGHIFIDASAKLFEHLLLYFQRLSFPLFWTRESGFDYALYAALRNEAAFFGVNELEQWIVEQKYLQLVTVESWFEITKLDVVHVSMNSRGELIPPAFTSPLTHSDDTVATIEHPAHYFWNTKSININLTKRQIRFSG